MALQLLQARIFSVTTWYHISFLVISVAMFGLTMGALHVHGGNEEEQRTNYASLMAESAQSFGMSMLMALAAQLLIPMVIVDNVFFTLLTLPTVCYFIVWPYYHAGVVLSLAITRAPYPVPNTYGVDLIGAASGCLFSILLMNAMDTPSGVLMLSLLSLLSSRCFAQPKNERKVAAGILLALLAVNLLLPSRIIFPLWMKAQKVIPAQDLALDQWNSISRVTVYNERTNAPPYLWGPSSKVPKDLRIPYYALQIDGCAESPIYRYAPGMNLDFLNYDVTTLAYALPSLKSACIIGLGGGRDVLSAFHAGVKEITALDINNIQIDLLSKTEPFASYAGLQTIPGLKLINNEARSWLSSNTKTFDIIQMSLIDTWAATGAGAFALSENGLYTLEAWKTFISRLNPHGVITISRWYLQEAHSETERLFSLAKASLRDSGAKNPDSHLFMASSDHLATLVLARDPFTAEQLNALDERAKEENFEILFSPRIGASSEGLESLPSANMDKAFDSSAATDDRPFFFNQVRLTNPAKVWELVLANSDSAIIGHARAIFHLYLIIVFSIIMVVAVIIYPQRKAVLGAEKKLAIAGSAWFLLIGLGFMLTEISLLQRMSTFLGHPSYGLGIVLFSLILATGMGSLLSGRIALDNIVKQLMWILLTCAVAASELYFINQGFIHFAGANLATRAALCIALILPLGILFGFGFPTGMQLCQRGGKNLAAWFWGINGAAGVLGSAIGVAISIAAGLNASLLIGALCYGLLLIPTLVLNSTNGKAPTV